MRALAWLVAFLTFMGTLVGGILTAQPLLIVLAFLLLPVVMGLASGLGAEPAKPLPVKGSLEALSARFLRDDLDVVEFILAVDAWTPGRDHRPPRSPYGMLTLPTNVCIPDDVPVMGGLPPTRPAHCSRCEIIVSYGSNERTYVCNGDCGRERP